MKSSPIYKYSIGYNLFKAYAKFAHRLYYKHYVVKREEPLNPDHSYIFAVSHQNALMDAMALHFALPGHLVFMARADIFKNPTTAYILRTFKILPIYRIRDGFESLQNNDHVFQEAVEVLSHHCHLAILPEGSHEGVRKLRPLKKGLARIAFQAVPTMKEDAPLQIVPIAIDYKDYFKFRSDVMIHFGKPFGIADYYEIYKQNPAKGLTELTQKIADELTGLMFHIDDPDYNFYYSFTDLLASEYSKNKDPYSLFEARKMLSEDALKYYEKHPEEKESAKQLLGKYFELKKQLGFKIADFNGQASPGKKLAIISGTVIGLPIYACGKLVECLPKAFIRSKLKKVKDQQFHSSFSYVLGMFIFPIFFLLVSALIGAFTGSFWWGLSSFIGMTALVVLSNDLRSIMEKTSDIIKLAWLFGSDKSKFQDFEEVKNKLRKHLSNIR